MPTQSQIDANRQNANSSTGPRTESGKSTSSRNSLTLGLFTRADYVKPEERDLYKDFCESMHTNLAPANPLEQSLTAEITGATWRLRRCSAVEADLADFAIEDPLVDETKSQTIRSLERARSTAHSVLHRTINQLRRLQTDRLKPKSEAQAEAEAEAEAEAMAEIEAFCAPPKLASICKPQGPPAQAARQIPRSAPCPCGSREKYKRCCGKNAPPVLGRAA